MSAKNLGCALCLKPTSPNERDYTFSLFVAFLLLCVLFCVLFLFTYLFSFNVLHFVSVICRSISAGPTDRTADKCY